MTTSHTAHGRTEACKAAMAVLSLLGCLAGCASRAEIADHGNGVRYLRHRLPRHSSGRLLREEFRVAGSGTIGGTGVGGVKVHLDAATIVGEHPQRIGVFLHHGCRSDLVTQCKF